MKPMIGAALLAAAVLVSACTDESIQVLKSPCVGIEGSPCGPKRPMNGDLNPHSNVPYQS